ncbi:MAG TPA: pyridoxamine 5'-phosphate oxidase family protein [Marmoricola sp.]
MTQDPARPAAQRKADALALLGSEVVDVWVATASDDDGSIRPHLVPVSLARLDDDRIVIAIQATSRTARDLTAHRAARLGVGPTRDVVMIDVELDEMHDVGDAPGGVVERYLAQADWDPRESEGYVFAVLRPTRLQAWREANEIAGRTLMREGRWLV